MSADRTSLRQCLAIMALPPQDQVLGSDALDPILHLVRAFRAATLEACAVCPCAVPPCAVRPTHTCALFPLQAPYHGQSVILLDRQPAQVMAQESFALHVLHASHAELWNPLTGAPLLSICRVRALRPDLSAEDNAELRELWSQELASLAGGSLSKGPSELVGLESRAPNPVSATLMEESSALQGWGGEPTPFDQEFSQRIQSLTNLLQGMNTSMDQVLGSPR